MTPFTDRPGCPSCRAKLVRHLRGEPWSEPGFGPSLPVRHYEFGAAAAIFAALAVVSAGVAAYGQYASAQQQSAGIGVEGARYGNGGIGRNSWTINAPSCLVWKTARTTRPRRTPLGGGPCGQTRGPMDPIQTDTGRVVVARVMTLMAPTMIEEPMAVLPVGRARKAT
jgi:hypothetical protein